MLNQILDSISMMGETDYENGEEEWRLADEGKRKILWKVDTLLLFWTTEVSTLKLTWKSF